MKDYCQFLKPEQPGLGLHCTAGTNFVSVGADRALCLVCPLANLGDVPLCKYADVCTALRKDKTGAPLIEVSVYCALGDSVSDDEARCAQCPARRGVGQVTDQTVAWLIPVLA
ncbi:MAG: hypothetical protein CVU38_00990 [Chloroflexi bacterium HGW-Chloroflexi-1]|nr:MAG: hypothetical protein CVU38_00990 [Chloroflexi bacterium HGW-Chloroflexi-1]